MNVCSKYSILVVSKMEVATKSCVILLFSLLVEDSVFMRLLPSFDLGVVGSMSDHFFSDASIPARDRMTSFSKLRGTHSGKIMMLISANRFSALT